MSVDTARGLFNKIDADGDGKIDQNEFSQWAKNGSRGGVTSSSSKIIKGDYSTVRHGGADFRTDASYESDAGFGGSGSAAFNRMDLNHDNVIDRSELNHFASGGRTVAGVSSSTDYVSRYRTDSRGFFLDPNPEIITRPDPGPAPTYTQKIIIRYLQPPPLPPVGENVIREVYAPPIQAPSPFLIREPGKPGYQPPPLILRERPPSPPPVTPPVAKTVILPPLPAPPRSTVIERFPNLPDHPRDIILERWLPYEPRLPLRTVRIPVTSGPLPDPPHNRIIEYQPLQVNVVREFQRLGVTRADPQAYIQQHGGSLLDSATFLQQVRAAGVVEDISPPAGAVVSFASSTYDQADGLTGSYLGHTSRNIITGSSEYSRDFGPESDSSEFTSSKRITRGSGFARGFDVAGTTVHRHEINSDDEVGGCHQQRL
jgi:hypothetical protein